MSRTGSTVLFLLGTVAVLLGTIVLVAVLVVRPKVEARAVDATATVIEGTQGMADRLGGIDDLLGEADRDLVGLRLEAGQDTVDAVRASLQERFPKVREHLQAIRDVARGLDALLGALDDVPFLDLGRVGTTRADALDGRLARALDEPVLDLAPVRELVADARTLVGDWRGSLDTLRGDVSTLQDDLPRLL